MKGLKVNFPTVKEIQEALDNNPKLLGDGIHKACFELCENWVILVCTFRGEPGDEWLQICSELGLVHAKFYPEFETNVWVVERLVLGDLSSDFYEAWYSKLEANFASTLQENFPTWYNAYQKLRTVYPNHYIYHDFHSGNYGFRHDGSVVMFDVFIVD